MFSQKRTTAIVAIVLLIIIASVGLIWFHFRNQEVLPAVEEVSQAINDEFAELIGYNEESVTPILDAIYSGFSVTINSVSALDTEENSFEVVCVLENYDVSETYASLGLQAQYMTVEDFYQLFAQELTQSRRLAKECTIKVTKNENDIYSAVFEEDSLDTAMGGFLSYFGTLFEEN